MALQRKQHWDTQVLHPFLVARAKTKFEWGKNDCCLFPADAIQAITGVDIASDFRGKYNTKMQAFMLIHSVTGGSSVADAAAYCAKKYGLIEHEAPLMAKRGDLAVVRNGDDLIAGIVHLTGRHVVSVSAEGLVKLGIANVVRSWSV